MHLTFLSGGSGSISLCKAMIFPPDAGSQRVCEAEGGEGETEGRSEDKLGPPRV